MVAAAVSAPTRADAVAAAPPSAIFVTIGFVVAADVAHSHGCVHADAVHSAGV
jgi:hypothetical protein